MHLKTYLPTVTRDCLCTFETRRRKAGVFRCGLITKSLLAKTTYVLFKSICGCIDAIVKLTFPLENMCESVSDEYVLVREEECKVTLIVRFERVMSASASDTRIDFPIGFRPCPSLFYCTG